MTTPNDGQADRIADELRPTGQAIHHYYGDQEREQLRNAGRRAERILNRPVRTFVRSDRMFILLEDWGDNPLEHQLDDIKTKNATDRVFRNR